MFVAMPLQGENKNDRYTGRVRHRCQQVFTGRAQLLKSFIVGGRKIQLYHTICEKC